MESITHFLGSQNVWVLMPLGGLLLGGIIIVKVLRQKHTERMEMIKRGMHPDAPKDSRRD